MAQDERRHVFVITPIGDEKSAVRTRADDLFDLVVVPTLNAFNADHPDQAQLAPARADKLPNPGVITLQIVQLIVGSAFVIVDTSGHNPNVFYELGIADAFQVPTIRVRRPKERLPFDTQEHRTLEVDHYDDGALGAREVNRLCRELRAQVDALLEDDFVLESVVTLAGRRAQLAEEASALVSSGEPVLEAIGVLREQMIELRDVVGTTPPDSKEQDGADGLRVGQDWASPFLEALRDAIERDWGVGVERQRATRAIVAADDDLIRGRPNGAIERLIHLGIAERDARQLLNLGSSEVPEDVGTRIAHSLGILPRGLAD